MAISKRSKVVSLTSVKPSTRKEKEAFIAKVLNCIENYEYIYVVQVENMRNKHFNTLRNAWKGSRFLFGKNRLMAHALKAAGEDLNQPSLPKLTERLHGSCGLLFTNTNVEETLEFFKSFRLPDFARANFVADKDIELPEGPLFRGEEKIPHNMEPELRKLGLNTYLDRGEVKLRSSQFICRVGEKLTVDQAHLLKHFYHMLADFQLSVSCYFHNGQVIELEL